MSDAKKVISSSSRGEVQEFLNKLSKTTSVIPSGRRGRLLFAMDATASRQPTWIRAQAIQSDMFDAAAALGGLEIQLCHYCGMAEFYVSPWLLKSEDLRRRMAEVECVGGYTQIGRVLLHAQREARLGKVDAVVFVGDCVEESIDDLSKASGELALLGVKAFVFQEGHDPAAEIAFRRIAALTGGAFCRFDSSSGQQLRDLLSAVAAYAAGGFKALQDLGKSRGGAALLLTREMKKT